MHWLYLVGAIMFEVLGIVSIKKVALTNSYYWICAIIFFYSISFSLIALAVKKIDIGIAYSIWAGLGTVAITILGWLIFKEVMSLQKVIAIGLIVIGSVMLKLQYQ